MDKAAGCVHIYLWFLKKQKKTCPLICSIKTPAARGTIYCMNCKVLVTGSIYRSFNRKVYLLALRRNLPVLINNEHEIPR